MVSAIFSSPAITLKQLKNEWRTLDYNLVFIWMEVFQMNMDQAIFSCIHNYNYAIFQSVLGQHKSQDAVVATKI